MKEEHAFKKKEHAAKLELLNLQIIEQKEKKFIKLSYI